MEQKIINGKCIEELKKIKNESIDLVVTDPPYNWSHKNKIDRIAFKKGSIKRRKSVSMDFGEWDYQDEKNS